MRNTVMAIVFSSHHHYSHSNIFHKAQQRHIIYNNFLAHTKVLRARHYDRDISDCVIPCIQSSAECLIRLLTFIPIVSRPFRITSDQQSRTAMYTLALINKTDKIA